MISSTNVACMRQAKRTRIEMRSLATGTPLTRRLLPEPVSVPPVIAARHKTCPRTTPAIPPDLVRLGLLKTPAPNPCPRPRPRPRPHSRPCPSPNRNSTSPMTMATIIMVMTSKRTTNRSASANTAQPLLPHDDPSNSCHSSNSSNSSSSSHCPCQPQRPAHSSPTYTFTRACASPAASITRAEPAHSTTPPTPTPPPHPYPRRCISALVTRCRARRWPSAYPSSPRRRSRSAGLPRPHRRPCLGFGRGTASMRSFLAPRGCPLRTVRLSTGTLRTIVLAGAATNRAMKMTLRSEDGHGGR